MGISIRVYNDSNSLLEIENSWNRELLLSSENPFLYSRLICEFMRFWESAGWTPLVFTFWSNDRLVGIVPLKIGRRLYSNYFCNLSDAIYSDFFLYDEYREICLTKLMSYLFEGLACRLGTITHQTGSPNLKMMKEICRNRGLNLWNSPFNGRALIPIETDWEMFYGTLDARVRKEFRRLERKIDGLGPWRISCFDLDSSSFETILAVEQASWKNTWREQNGIKEDYILRSIFRASQPNEAVESIYKTEVWFLEVEGKTIAYHLVLLFKSRSFFTKTSYNEQFRKFSPGKFLMNALIRKTFQKGDSTEIDFITNLPVLQIWNPICEYRTKLNVERNFLLSAVRRVRFNFFASVHCPPLSLIPKKLR